MKTMKQLYKQFELELNIKSHLLKDKKHVKKKLKV